MLRVRCAGEREAGACVQVVRLVDALAVRIAGSAECRKMDLQLDGLGRKISHVEAQLAPNRMHGLKYEVETVVAAIDAMVCPAPPCPRSERAVCLSLGPCGSAQGTLES